MQKWKLLINYPLNSNVYLIYFNILQFVQYLSLEVWQVEFRNSVHLWPRHNKNCKTKSVKWKKCCSGVRRYFVGSVPECISRTAWGVDPELPTLKIFTDAGVENARAENQTLYFCIFTDNHRGEGKRKSYCCLLTVAEITPHHLQDVIKSLFMEPVSILFNLIKYNEKV